VPHGNSDKLRNRVLERARQILLLGLDSYHDPDLCELCLLSRLEAWRSDDESLEDDSR
jgi:hypothetical protein